MTKYECEKCGWKGDSLQVENVAVYKLLNVEAHEVEDEEEQIEICPFCLKDSDYTDYQVVNETC